MRARLYDPWPPAFTSRFGNSGGTGEIARAMSAISAPEIEHRRHAHGNDWHNDEHGQQGAKQEARLAEQGYQGARRRFQSEPEHRAHDAQLQPEDHQLFRSHASILPLARDPSNIDAKGNSVDR
jgi:hypothetical protein